MNVSFKELSKSPGYKSLKKSVLFDCNDRHKHDGPGCFNPLGCDKGRERRNQCHHRPCDKFKWAIDRAQHYSHYTGVSVVDILNTWEKGRSYWYQNYYQNANQPKLTEKQIAIFDTVQELVHKVGRKGFRCPACGGISHNPYICTAKTMKKVKHKRRAKQKACDWKIYGLLGDLGKGLYVFVKEKAKGEKIFMPVALENA